MRFFRTLLLIFIATNFFSQSNNYVSIAGNNSTGDGSIGNPYLTVQYAVDQASIGDSIIIGAGTFEEEITVNKTLNFRGNGVESTKLYLDVANYQYKKLMWVRSDTVSY